MNSKTRTILREIQLKIKSPITVQKEFINENAVIDYAVKTIYDLMKQQKII